MAGDGALLPDAVHLFVRLSLQGGREDRESGSRGLTHCSRSILSMDAFSCHLTHLDIYYAWIRFQQQAEVVPDVHLRVCVCVRERE
jgi:hypothetical protein